MKRSALRRATGRRNVTDAPGTVQVKVMLVRDGRPVLGNIIRSFSVWEETVGEVAERVERALFGKVS